MAGWKTGRQTTTVAIKEEVQKRRDKRRWRNRETHQLILRDKKAERNAEKSKTNF